jgi:hypothetical protein
MANRQLNLENVRVVAEWTIHEERAHFSIIFPPEEDFTVGTVGTVGNKDHIDLPQTLCDNPLMTGGRYCSGRQRNTVASYRRAPPRRPHRTRA